MLAKALFPGIQDLFELGDHRLRRRVMDRKNTDRLAAHPILIKTQDGLDGRAALDAIANHEYQIFLGISRIEPGFVAKLSRSFVIVCTET